MSSGRLLQIRFIALVAIATVFVCFTFALKLGAIPESFFAILLTVPAQEFLEHSLAWGDSRLALALRVAIEELAGSLAILWAVSCGLRARLAQTGRKDSEVFGIARFRPALLACLIAIVLMPPVIVLSAFIGRLQRHSRRLAERVAVSHGGIGRV